MIRIAHLADIHIQNRRRDEYRAVFADLYAALRKEAPTVIAVVGDVFDDKMRASAHNLEDVAAFLAALADVAPVVLIPGNHDTDVTRPGSLDLLSPLLADHRLLTPPRLTYWRRSGVYCAHGVEWHVKAPDGPRPLAGAADDSGLPRVCLFHEELNGALLPNGQRLRDFALGRGDLAGYDAALGGHIHLRQQLGRAGYCGSLVQQNIGERHVGHGFVVWDLRPGPGHAPYRTAPPTVRGVDIPNRLGGFLRVVISAEGADRTAQPALPAPLYWELVHDARAPGAAVEAAAAAYTARLGQPPRAVRPCGRDGRDGGAPAAPALAALSAPGAPATPSTDLAEAHEAFSSPEAHAALIRRVLGATPRAEAVVALHAGRWQAGAAPALRGARVRLLRLEFDDLYCFGPGNVVDFTRLEGAVSGTVAPNHAGKSSLIEALLLALYEEHPRAATKAEVIRAGARGCRLALDFEIDGRRGRVEKAFGPGKGRAGYRLTYANEDRSQGDIPGTLREARALLGSAEAALATSVQLQGAEAAGFVAARPLERRRLLAAALELGRFTELERAAGRQLAELKGEARGLASQFCGSDAAALDRALGAAEGRAAAAGAAAVAADGEAASADACLASAEARAADARARVGEAPAAGVPESGAECLALRDAWLALAAENAGVLRAPGLARARARPPPPAGRSECGRSRLAAARAAKAQTAGALAAAQAAQAETENAHALLAARDEGLAQAAALAAGLEATRKGLDTQLGELRSLPLRQLAALFPELPEAPAAPPEPELPFPGFAERSGPRPEAGELAEALQLARAAEPGA
ncbi:MAG TPA: metallophosphoesterase, partial [Elusimicrobiota bacterium]|nr:metallophosphoesterase [Elusimicrobiota bacterium]